MVFFGGCGDVVVLFRSFENETFPVSGVESLILERHILGVTRIYRVYFFLNRSLGEENMEFEINLQK
jgi:hypothetical protein